MEWAGGLKIPTWSVLFW